MAPVGLLARFPILEVMAGAVPRAGLLRGGMTMKPTLPLVLMMLSPLTGLAQESSRVIPSQVATTFPGGTTQDVTVQLWDVPVGGTAPLFFEPRSQLPVGDDGSISFLLG